MWKKAEETTNSVTPAPSAAPRKMSNSPIATIGPSLMIRGDLTGDEDLVIQGRVEGEVRLAKNSVTVGKNGQVRADIHGHSIHVEGEVRGNLHGQQEVVIHASGRVQGNIIAPRVTLENGSKFKGSIDMDKSVQKKSQTPPAGAQKAAEKVDAPKEPPVQTKIDGAPSKSRPGAATG